MAPTIGRALARRRLALTAIVAALASTASPGFAQTGPWPQRPVTLVVAFAPGGMTDIVSRSLAKELSQAFNQPFIIENRAGAAGQVGTEYVARRPNDGYTLLVSATGHVIAKIMNSPEMTERLKAQYSEPGGSLSVPETRQYVEREVAKWQQLVQKTGVKSGE